MIIVCSVVKGNFGLPSYYKEIMDSIHNCTAVLAWASCLCWCSGGAHFCLQGIVLDILSTLDFSGCAVCFPLFMPCLTKFVWKLDSAVPSPHFQLFCSVLHTVSCHLRTASAHCLVNHSPTIAQVARASKGVGWGGAFGPG